ncbi:MAG: hypothetical protein ABGW90_04535, partial [Martelella sp.]
MNAELLRGFQYPWHVRRRDFRKSLGPGCNRVADCAEEILMRAGGEVDDDHPRQRRAGVLEGVDVAGPHIEEIAFSAAARFSIQDKFDLAFRHQESFAVLLVMHRRARARRTETLGDGKRSVGVAGAGPEGEKVSEKVDGVGGRFVVQGIVLHLRAFLFND